MIASYLVGLALMAIGYVPPQALRTRRAAMFVGLFGLLLIPVALGALRLAAVSPNQLWIVVAVVWVCIVGYGIFCGAILRYVMLGRPPMTATQRWAMIAAGFVVFALVGWLGLREASGQL